MLTVQIGYSVYDFVVGFQWRVDFLDEDLKRPAFFLDLMCLDCSAFGPVDFVSERSLISTQDLEQVAELTRRLILALRDPAFCEILELPEEVVC